MLRHIRRGKKMLQKENTREVLTERQQSIYIYTITPNHKEHSSVSTTKRKGHFTASTTKHKDISLHQQQNTKNILLHQQQNTKNISLHQQQNAKTKTKTKTFPFLLIKPVFFSGSDCLL